MMLLENPVPPRLGLQYPEGSKTLAINGDCITLGLNFYFRSRAGVTAPHLFFPSSGLHQRPDRQDPGGHRLSAYFPADPG